MRKTNNPWNTRALPYHNNGCGVEDKEKIYACLVDCTSFSSLFLFPLDPSGAQLIVGSTDYINIDLKEILMKIGILGTGMVGQNIGARLAELGHEVMIGTRDVTGTMTRTEPDMYGNPPFREWIKKNNGIKVGTFSEAAAQAELTVNATTGISSMDALNLAGKDHLDGKILIDIANPLDFSRGTFPVLSTCNTDSLGEQIQRAFPGVKVVKTLNTVNAKIMVNPSTLQEADHTMFLCGNDAGAKAIVTDLLRSMGWNDITDLGDISAARATEMILPIWIRLYGVLKSPMFNFKLVR